jgi:hypothetical protein
MNRNKIVLGLGILTFFVGFIFISLVSFFANTRVLDVNDMEDITELQIMYEGEARFTRTMGSWSLLGLALISIGVIVILLTKFEK